MLKTVDSHLHTMPMHQGFLPREGFCLDVVLKLFRRTAGNPALLLPLILLARFSKKGQDWAILHPKAARRLRVLFYFAILRRLSAWYSDKLRNNWVDDKYVWSREIVLVTGGAAGIGASMVRYFAEKGITVVVLDVQSMTMKTSAFGPAVLRVFCFSVQRGVHGLTSYTNRFEGTLLSMRP